MDKQPNQKGVDSGGGIFGRLIYKQAAADAYISDHNDLCNTPRRSEESGADATFVGVTSSSRVNGGAFVSSEEYVRDPGALLSLQPWVFKKGNYRRNDEIQKVNGGCSEQCSSEMVGFMYKSLAEISSMTASLGNMHGRGRSSLRTRRSRRRSIKPVSSTRNCLIPQHYNQNFEIEEEFGLNPFPSPSAPALRPFFVTDGNRIISKSSFGEITVPFDSIIDKGVMKNVTEISPLSELRISKQKSRATPHGGTSFNSKRSNMLSLHKDSLDGIRIFCVGISLGIISTMLSNRKEIDELNNMLTSSENLVQDLQEELEMKESLTVKELVDEGYGCNEPTDNVAIPEPMEPSRNLVSASSFPTEQKDESYILHLPKEDSRSQIEAELEIELERLELNINASSINGITSSSNELDSDLVADVVQGALKADKLPGGFAEDSASDGDGASTDHVHNANYVVSPRELSIRLHEVIQRRLEERIKELERDLEQTQKQLHLVESEHLFPQRAFSSSEMGSSSCQDSPREIAGDPALSQPFCLNLAGDALDAYGEAYEEFMRVADAEKSPSIANNNEELRCDLHSSERSIIWGMEGSEYCGREPMWEMNSNNSEVNDELDIHATNGDDYKDDEMKRLIEQVLERTRQGSPIVLHARRMLFSMDQ